MVRPSGFEPPTFCSGGKVAPSILLISRSVTSAATDQRGAFGAYRGGFCGGRVWTLEKSLPEVGNVLCWCVVTGLISTGSGIATGPFSKAIFPKLDVAGSS